MGNTKRSRGYHFEHYLVQKFTELGYISRRLGGSSTGLPDIVSTKDSKIYAVEAKATSSGWSYIPNDEIKRCLDILNMFSIYTCKMVLFAFKFRAIKGVRKLKHYFFLVEKIDGIDNVKSITCNYNGVLKINKYEKNKSVNIKYYPEPLLS